MFHKLERVRYSFSSETFSNYFFKSLLALFWLETFPVRRRLTNCLDLVDATTLMTIPSTLVTRITFCPVIRLLKF